MKIRYREVHFIVILFFGLQAFWEAWAVGERGTWCNHCHEGSLLYFLLYNTGNINNSAITCYIFLFVLDQISPKSDFLNRLLAIILVNIIFFFIEKNDLPDIPFAILGTLIFFSPKIIFGLKESGSLKIQVFGNDKKSNP